MFYLNLLCCNAVLIYNCHRFSRWMH